MKRNLLFIHLFAFSLFNVNAQTESPTDSIADAMDKIYNLEEVSVTAARLNKEIIKPQRLEGKLLERLNSLSVADAIRFFSGVQIKDYGGRYKDRQHT